jgi:hypothetical protein
MCLGVAVLACGKAGPIGTTPEAGQGVAATSDEASTADADAGTRKEQCERLGGVIEQVETGTSIVNVNDRPKMTALAAERRAAAQRAADVTVDEAALIAIRDRYAELCHAMATALDGVASPDRDARVAAVEEHSRLDADVGALVDELNAACSAP